MKKLICLFLVSLVMICSVTTSYASTPDSYDKITGVWYSRQKYSGMLSPFINLFIVCERSALYTKYDMKTGKLAELEQYFVTVDPDDDSRYILVNTKDEIYDVTVIKYEDGTLTYSPPSDNKPVVFKYLKDVLEE